MKLTYEQRRHFYEDGYVKIPGVVPKVKVQAAVRAINHSLGEYGMDPQQLPIFRAQSYCFARKQSAGRKRNCKVL